MNKPYVCMKMKKYILYFLLGALVSGCGGNSSSHVLEDVIKENPQLREVLKRYEADTLKLRAAEFLIENLPSRWSVIRNSSNFMVPDCIPPVKCRIQSGKCMDALILENQRLSLI